MDTCTNDISPPATPPSFHFPSSSPFLSRPKQRLRTRFNDPLLSDRGLLFDDDQLQHVRELKQSFQQLSPQLQQVFLYEVINNCCDNGQLTYLNNLISPRLKIDFLKELPIEISLHILAFIDDPRTLARAATVSTFWNSLLKDEATWKQLCMKHHYRRRQSSICGGELLQPPSQRRNFSYRHYFKHKYNIAAAWAQGGQIQTVDQEFGEGLVTSLQFDEKYIVVGCDNRRIEVFDTATARKVRTLSGHEGGVWALQFKGGDKHDPERILVTGGCDRDVRVWSLDTFELLHIMRGHNSTVRCLKMKDKKIAVTGSRDTTLRVWDIERGVVVHVLLGHQRSVRCLEINGNTVVSGSYDNTARVWDIQTGRCLHVLSGHTSQIYSIAFDGVKVVTGSLDSNIRVWSADSGQCISVLHGHTSLVGQLQLTGSTLVSGGSDGCVRVWDLQHYECIHQISAHDNSVTCLQFDDRRILSAGNDGKIKLWDIKQGRLIRSFTKPAKTVWKVQFTDTRAVVLMQRERSPGSEEGKTVMEVHNFDIATEPVIHIKEDENEDEELEQVIFSQEPTDMIVDTNL